MELWSHQDTWKKVLQRPASQLMHTPVRLKRSSAHNWHA